MLLLYGFLFNLAGALRRELRADAARSETGLPGATGAETLEGRLIVLQGGSAGLGGGRSYPLAAETLIGRAPEVHVKLDDRLISGRHARLFRRDGRWYLEDLGSTNGTVLNQQALDGPRPVDYGDVIEVGGVRLKLAR